MEEKSLIQQLKLLPKIIGLVIGLCVVFFVTKNAGFPIIFVKMYMCFVCACFVFFVLLDVPEMAPLKGGFRPTRNLLITFLLASGVYTVAGWSHPQFTPAFEIAKMNTPPIKSLPTGPEAIEAGYGVFMDNKCVNCHKTTKGGSSDRGPDLFAIQIGIYAPEWIKQQIVEPRKRQHPGFEDEKSKMAMPTYFGEDIQGMNMDLLIVFLQSQIDDTKMPTVGRTGEMKKWVDVPEKVAFGKKVFEGEANADVNCSVCHGKDATPVMQGAAEFKNPNWTSNRTHKPFKEYLNSDLFTSIMYGVKDTPMMAWSELGLTREQAWGAVAYIRAEFQKDFKKD